MPFQRCDAGKHFYNTDKHDMCPYCREEDAEGATQRKYEGRGAEDPTAATRPKDGVNGPTRKTVHAEAAPSHSKTIFRQGPAESSDVTVGVFKKKKGFDPVVGWLVCISGEPKGNDYRIRHGSNRIGRDHTEYNRIVITGDDTISRKDHAEIVYDHVENLFLLFRKESSAVRINGKLLRREEELNTRDIIKLGDSEFIFIPFCSQELNWEILAEVEESEKMKNKTE